MSYQEVDDRASALAARLIDRGVGPESLVGVYLPKSPAAIISLLAVLKAGGAFTPLDLARPAGDLARLPLDAVVSDREVPAGVRARAIPVLGVTADGPAGRQRRDPPPAATPRNLAYVIYTSGSTGQPKGVAVEHRSIVASTLARLRMYPPARAFLLLSPVGFDSAMAGIFGTLASGGALVLPGQGAESDTREMARLIARHRVDALLALPSLFRLILDSAGPRELGSLRTVTVAGEPCPPGLLTACREAVPQVQLVNEYGPTECTVWCTAWRAPAGEVTDADAVPIGSPVEGTRIHLLDEAWNQVPDGQVGQICVAGAGVARGYLGRPGLTAAAFVPEPVDPGRSGASGGGRMYLSGDLGWRRPDGHIVFAGRLDRQVKIRGFRVEPGEVEQALLEMPSVREAAVLPSPQAPTSALVGFISGDAEPAAAREHLGSRLPGYLVPAQVISLGALPRGANGKLDYHALASLLTSGRAERGDAPRSPVEHVVAQIWGQVLGRAEIGRSQRFADIGGSLEAVMIALHLSPIFASEVPISWVYEAATVSELAHWLEANSGKAESAAEEWLATRAELASERLAGGGNGS